MRIIAAHKEQLSQLGLLTRLGAPTPLKACARRYKFVIDSLAGLPELVKQPNDLTTLANQIAKPLNTPSWSYHPLRQLLLIFCLYESWEKFKDLYSSVPLDQREAYGAQSKKEISDNKQNDQERFLKLVREGRSIRAAAWQTGIDVHVGSKWCKLNRIGLPGTKTLIDGEVELSIIRWIHRGASLQEIGLAHSMSDQTIRRYVQSSDELWNSWTAIRTRNLRDDHRKKWERALINDRSPTEARSQHKALYAWLYRNDRSWLRSVNADHSLQAVRSRRQADWGSQDILLSCRLRAVCEELSNRGLHPINVLDLFAHIPRLRASLLKLHMMPLSQRYLARVIQDETFIFSSRAQETLFRNLNR